MSSKIFTKKTKRNVAVFDLFFFALFLAVIVFSFVSLKNIRKSTRGLVIQTSSETYVYDLTKDTIINIEGDLGLTKIEILSGFVRFLDSPCPNKTCVQSASIHSSGQWIACLPNQVFAHIEGSDDSEIDAMAQ
ncbi:MAG: NusG domain II-containing protein [Treponema sp.]|nr:NusG domain II-containing protein [Treponema sp.]